MTSGDRSELDFAVEAIRNAGASPDVHESKIQLLAAISWALVDIALSLRRIK